MPAGIGLIARDGHAKPVGQGHDLLDESFARAVAEAIADDDSRTMPRLTLGNGGHAVQVEQQHAGDPRPPRGPFAGKPRALGSLPRFAATVEMAADQRYAEQA